MRKPKDWGQPCPNCECRKYNLINRGNVRAVSTYMTERGRRRIFQCTICGTSFSETRDTVFFDLRPPRGEGDDGSHDAPGESGYVDSQKQKGLDPSA